MERLGRNPARIIPAWRDFVAAPAGRGRPVRGIGEPIWPGRHAEELAECQLHEAILNVAIDPAAPLWLICPYDVVTLAASVIEEAHRSHPVIVDAGEYRGSASYGGRAHVEELFGGSLSEPGGRARGGVYGAELGAPSGRLRQARAVRGWVVGRPGCPDGGGGGGVGAGESASWSIEGVGPDLE